jgi:hypothetical protein
MMAPVRTSKLSVNFKVTTRRYIPEGSKLDTEGIIYSDEKTQLNISG